MTDVELNGEVLILDLEWKIRDKGRYVFEEEQ